MKSGRKPSTSSKIVRAIARNPCIVIPVPRDVQRPECAPQRAAAHRQLPVRMAGVREDVAMVPRQRMNLAKDRGS